MPSDIISSMEPYVPALIVFITAFVIAVVIIAFFWYKDRYEKEPASFVFAMFIWGIIAALMSAIVESVTIDMIKDTYTYNIIFVPFVEEFFIALGLLLLSRHREYESTMDGIVYGVSVGAGFVFFRNMTYGLSLLGTLTLAAAIYSMLLQSLLMPLPYLFFAAWFGAEVGRTKMKKTTKKEKFPGSRTITIPIAFLTVWLFHSLWNMAGVYSLTELTHATITSIIILVLMICLFYSKFKEALIMDYLYFK